MNMNRRQVMRSGVMMALAAAILIGCGKKGGDEYVGNWLDKDRKTTTIQIERNGEGFLMKTTNVNRRGEKSESSIPATLKDGVLNYQNGPAAGTVTYVKAQDEILVSTFAGNLALTRVK